jgi:hypothetical protein
MALVAIGLAVWALIGSGRDQRSLHGTRGTSSAMVALISQANHLETTVRFLSSHGGTGTANASLLAAQVSQLAGREAALSVKVSHLVGKHAALSGQVSGLQGRVSLLAAQVAQLNAQPGAHRNSTGPPIG